MDKLQFIPRRQFGMQIYFAKNSDKYSIIYNEEDKKYYIRILKNGDWHYPTWQSDGFNKLKDAQDFLNLHNWEDADVYNIEENQDNTESEMKSFIDAMETFKFIKDKNPFFSDVLVYIKSFKFNDNDILKDVDIRIMRFDDGSINTLIYLDGKRLPKDKQPADTYSVDTLVKTLDKIFNKYNYDIFSCVYLTNEKSVINAAISTRDLTKNMVRVKSSNVWGYNINIKSRKDKTGDVVVQFKGKNGGPDDIYIYYDVPIKIFRKWHSAPSKGHYFWKYIRNYYKYSKLTGDKRGKLQNAIN